jgi:hypothetical protein
MAVGSARFGGMFAVKSADAHIRHAEREGKLRHSRLQHGETVVTEEG